MQIDKLQKPHILIENVINAISALESPERAYILGTEFEKMGKAIKEANRKDFESYIDGMSIGSLPWGYEVKETYKPTYNYDEDEKYQELKKQLKAREEELKNACLMAEKGAIYVDCNGEIVPTVTRLYSKALTVTNKNK